MLLIYIAYLFLGAGKAFDQTSDLYLGRKSASPQIVVFSFLESKAEEKKCFEAKKNVSDQKSDFSKKYFYIFGLNFKFCKGIEMYKAKTDPAQLALDAAHVKRTRLRE